MEKFEKYFQLAKFNAELFSKDPTTKVGAILLKPDLSAVVSTGINGFPRKLCDTDPKRWERPTKYKYVTHAEVNAVANAARLGVSTDGCVAIVSLFPCKECAKILIQSGVSHIYTEQPDFDNAQWGKEFEISKEMLDEVGIPVTILKNNRVYKCQT